MTLLATSSGRRVKVTSAVLNNVKSIKQRTKLVPPHLLKLDLGCGDNKREGFTGVDIVKTSATNIVHDLFRFPWPFKDASVEEAYLSHFFEHIPHLIRPRFMDELYRVLAVAGKVVIISPYYTSMRSIQDYTHEWPPICEATFLYFNKGWREQNKLAHYAINCDFDFTYGYIMDPAWASRSDEARQFATCHYWNVVGDLQVTLTKRGEVKK